MRAAARFVSSYGTTHERGQGGVGGGNTTPHSLRAELAEPMAGKATGERRRGPMQPKKLKS